MATAVNYHGKHCTITLKDDGESTTYLDNTSSPVNAKGFDLTVTQDIDELFTQDSVTRQDVVRTAIRCEVAVSYVKNDGILLSNILGTQTADQDIDGSSNAGTTRGSIDDTPTLNLFNIWGIVTNGSNVFKVKVTNVAFTAVPLLVAPEDGWVQVDLEGSGDAVFTQYTT